MRSRGKSNGTSFKTETFQLHALHSRCTPTPAFEKLFDLNVDAFFELINGAWLDSLIPSEGFEKCRVAACGLNETALEKYCTIQKKEG